MNIGLISDIHADYAGLQRALALLATHQVEKIVCAGDLVHGHTPGEAVVAHLRAASIPCVLGNNDERAAQPGSPHYRRLEAAERRPDDLTEASLDFLKQLPRTHSFTVGDVNIMVAHGTPLSNLMYVFPESDHHVFELVAHSAASDIVILGHTHEPMIARRRGLMILNPGSVTAHRGSGTCAVLTLPEFNFTVYRVASGERVEPAQVNF